MSADSATLDPSAYDRFSVILYGSSEVIAAVQTLRETLPPSGRPILPAHVTVKGTFVHPTDLARSVETLRSVCAGGAPILLTAATAHVWQDGAHAGAKLEVERSEALESLHRQLVSALADHGETIYPGEAEGEFHPHLTIVQEVAAERAEAIERTIAAHANRFTWVASEVALVGRRGGTVWETLASVPLGAATTAP